MDATVVSAPGGLIPAAQVLVFQFDASGNIQSGAHLYSNAELNPQNVSGLGTYYLVSLYNANGALLNKAPLFWQFTEGSGSTVDISQMVAFLTNGNIIYYPIPATSAGTVTSVAMFGDGTIFNTSVSGSPITTSGFLQQTLISQTAKTFLAGPTSGPIAAPTFRTILTTDLPISGTWPFSGIISGNPQFSSEILDGTGSPGTSGWFLKSTGTGIVWAAIPAAGVTSVAMTMDGVIFNSTVSGSPITSTGTLAPSLISQTAATFFAGPVSGPIATPTFRTIANSDLPTSGVTAGSYTNANITVNAQGIVTAAASGSAGFTNPMTTLGDIIYENATPAPARLAGNTTATKQVLTQTGTGTISAAPVWGVLAASDLSNGTTGSGAVVLAGSPALTGSPTAPTQATGDNSTKIATDAFVTTAITNAIAGVNPAVAVQAATAAILPNSPTYLNGAGGIGATITAGVTNTTLVVDGYTPILNDRILVKNESSGGGLGAGKNGVYFVSQLASLGLAWILTRALDYDQPSDINSTGAIPVIQGTVNTTTQWVLTSSITAVDGIQALTYALFSVNPSTILTNPMTTLGDLIYENATPAATRLAGNTTTIKKYLSQTGTGSISATPAWAQVAAADLSDGTLGTGAVVLASAIGAGGSSIIGVDTPPATTPAENDEFNSSTLNAKWTVNTNTVSVVSIDTVIPGAIWVKTGTSSTAAYAITEAVASGSGNIAFTVKMSAAALQNFQAAAFDLYDSNTIGTNTLEIQVGFNSSMKVQAYKYVSNVQTSLGVTGTLPQPTPVIYVHLQRKSTTVAAFYSFTGMDWFQIFSSTGTGFNSIVFSQARITLFNNGGTTSTTMWCDWIRRDWIDLLP